MRFLRGFLVLLLLVTGCGGGASGTGAFTELTYHVTGGIAGLDRQLIISGDGAVRFVESGRQVRTGRLTGAELKAVRELTGQVGWAGLKPSYVNPRVADSLFETVTVIFQGKTYETTVGTEGGAPDALLQLLAELAQLMTAQSR